MCRGIARGSVRHAAVGNTQEGSIPVELRVEGDAGRTYRGFVQNFDNKLDSRSGTIRARARFDNADRTLVPGMFGLGPSSQQSGSAI